MENDPFTDSTRWQRLDELFHAALELPEQKRAGYVDEVCAGDDFLRLELERLLAFDDDDSASFTAKQAFHGSSVSPPLGFGEGEAVSGMAGKLVGPYRLDRLIGTGGMGAVWHGERADEQYRGEAAIKLIRWGAHSDDILRRFRMERQVLANLDHPNIARLLDGAATEDGSPYLVMEYVDGLPIDRYCTEHNLSVSERLGLFRKVCAAVQHAHRHLVVHRDLKPSNILVNAEGEPKLLDFGIAKVLRTDELSEWAEETSTNAPVMTPRYASPEQIEGALITTASDVYALGGVLYKMLTGRLPHEVEGNIAELFQAICESTPPRPSSINAALDHEVDAIVLRALAKETDRRYPSVESFGADIKRYLAGEPVVAHPPGAWYQLRKFVGRRRLIVSLTVTIVALAMFIGVGGWFLAAQLAHERDRAVTAQGQEAGARATSQRITRFLQAMLASAQPHQVGAQDVTVREILNEAATQVDEELAGQPEVQAAVRLTIGETYRSLGLYEEAEPHLRYALETRRTLFDPSHPDVLVALDRYATLLEDMGKYGEAEALFRTCLDQWAQQPDDHALAVAMAQNNLALLLNNAGRYDEAETLLRAALVTRRDLLGEEDSLVASTMAGLASVLSHQGRNGEAEDLFEDALAIHRAVLGDDHVDTIMTKAELGTCLLEQRKLDRAESMLREAHGGLETVFGAEHPDTVKILNNLAGVSANRAQWDEARLLLEEVLRIRRDTLGAEHPDVAIALNNLAGVVRRQGDLELAAALYAEAVEVARSSVGAQHPLVVATLNNLAFVLYKQGDLDGAETYLRQSTEVQRELLGATDSGYADGLGNLARLLETKGDLEEVEVVYGEMVQIYRANLGEMHLTVATVLLKRGKVLILLERFEEAEMLLLDSYAVLQGAGPPGQTALRENIASLVELYDLWGKPEQAAGWRDKLEAPD